MHWLAVGNTGFADVHNWALWARLRRLRGHLADAVPRLLTVIGAAVVGGAGRWDETLAAASVPVSVTIGGSAASRQAGRDLHFLM